MGVSRAIEAAVSSLANLGWMGFQVANRFVPDGSFQPPWAPRPLLKSSERTSPTLGWPRTTDSLCPTCVREARTKILAGQVDLSAITNSHIGEIKAQIVERDGKIVMEKTCPEHGTFSDVIAINPAFLKRIERLFPGRDYFALTDNLHNHGTSSIKYGRGIGADDRPDQPLQHDVRPVLHGREPGRLRPRALARRGQADPRRFDHHQAAAADVGAVLRRRADDLANLSGLGRLRAPGRLLQRPGRHQRHRVRAGSGVRHGGGEGGPAHRLPAVRRRQRGGQRAPQGRQPLRSEAARDREPASRRHRHRAGRHDRARRSTTTRSAGSSGSRSRTATRSASSPSSRCRSPAATKRSTTRRARGIAIRSRTWRKT